MSDPTFVQQVADALGAIPHGANCELSADDTTPPLGPCDCDREERIAQRVAAAIEALTSALPSGGATSREAAVRVLRSLPEPDTERPS